MLRRCFPALFLTILISLISLFTVGCGGNAPMAASSNSNNSTPSGAMGSMVFFGQDAPVCDVISFNVTITGATLTPQGGGTPVSVVASGSPVTVDFARLMDFSTVLSLASVPAGTYSQLTLTLSNPQLTVLDVTQSPPAAVAVSTTLSSSTLTVNITPGLVVTTSASAGLELDFNLRHSVQVDSSGQVTGSVTPSLQAEPSTESAPDDLKDIDDLAGMVQSVSTTSTNSAFNGSLTLLTEEGDTFIVDTTSNTEFEDVASLSAMAAGTFIEARVFVDSGGNIVANEIEGEEEEDEGQHRSAFVGLVTSVTRDTSGNATQFKMFVRGEEPDEGAMAPKRSTITVNLANSTRFQIGARGLNEAGLTFNASAIGPGQELVVHARVHDGAPAPTVDASSVFLRPQSILGNFAILLGKQSDNKTGGFTLVSCAAFFMGQPMDIFTFPDTAFANVSDLTALTPQPTLVVKGLLFYQQQPITINGIAVATTPTVVVEAKQVHQLNP